LRGFRETIKHYIQVNIEGIQGNIKLEAKRKKMKNQPYDSQKIRKKMICKEDKRYIMNIYQILKPCKFNCSCEKS
jgi:hypothetical protein